MWAHTGIPRSTRNYVVSAMTAPPSSFTICAPAARVVDALDQEVQVLRVRDEVQALAVHDEERPLRVVVEMPRVRLREAPQVVLVDAALRRVSALLHARDQRLDRGLQVDHEV